MVKRSKIVKDKRRKTATVGKKRPKTKRKMAARKMPATGGRLVLSLFFVVSASVWIVTMTAVGTLAFREIRETDWDAAKGPAMIVSENLGFAAGFAPEAAGRIVLGGREVFGALTAELKSSLVTRFTAPQNKEKIVWRSWIRRYFAMEPEMESPFIVAAPSLIEPASGPSSWVRSVERGMAAEF